MAAVVDDMRENRLIRLGRVLKVRKTMRVTKESRKRRSVKLYTQKYAVVREGNVRKLYICRSRIRNSFYQFVISNVY